MSSVIKREASQRARGKSVGRLGEREYSGADESENTIKRSLRCVGGGGGQQASRRAAQHIATESSTARYLLMGYEFFATREFGRDQKH